MPNHALARRRLAALLVAAAPITGSAFGVDGHRIAGLLAAPLLCSAAGPEITALVGNRPFEDLGLWADTIRDDEAWAHSAPWHYMNVEDGESIRGYEHPAEGDVLWAIDNFSRVLADRSQPAATRAAALQFLVHFIVDIHQPLHVGRAVDRGGNMIEVRHRRTSTNLHSFWDTDVLAGLSADRYARRLESVLDNLPRNADDLDPVTWAEESLALRPQVYSFDQQSGELDNDYVELAEAAIERRLAQSALRLAETLNRIFCPASQ
jgi:hypothetical protein